MSAVTNNISLYVRNKGINLSQMARDTGISYPALYTSLCDDERDRSLRDYELVAICKFLDVDPRIFADQPDKGEMGCGAWEGR